jgi:hypothetical protein
MDEHLTTMRHPKAWAILSCLASLFLGAASLLWADFGMPAWFFFFTQVWFWTIGLPTMLGVLAVAAVWGIPGWTTWPAWAFIVCTVLVALAFQTGSVFLLTRARRLAGGKKS